MNGAAARLPPELELPAVPTNSHPSTRVVEAASAQQAEAEILIGEAVASAVCGLCFSLLEYQAHGRVRPEIKDTEAVRLAKVVELQLAHEFGDLDFKVVAHAQARPLLRQAFDAEFYRRFSTEEGDAVIAFYVDAALELAGKVVAIERTFAN